jgi:hypothetical protein
MGNTQASEEKERELLKHWYKVYERRHTMNHEKWVHYVIKQLRKPKTSESRAGIPVPVKGRVWLKLLGCDVMLENGSVKEVYKVRTS